MLHLLNSPDEVKEPQRVCAWTPDGYVAGFAYGRDWDNDALLVELDDGSLVALRYVYASRPYGPHWTLRPDWDAYELKTKLQWEGFQSAFPSGWQRDACTDDRPKPPAPAAYCTAATL